MIFAGGRYSALLLVVSMAACGGSSATPAASGFSAMATSLRPALVSPDLRTASTYAILAGSTVTSTGPTKIRGNVGLFPGSAITGFPPGVIHGQFHVAGPLAQQAELDLKRAYNDAMGRTRAPVAVAGNLGGRTLAPGLYKSTSSLAVSSGDLTLDGGGNANAVYIFQMASTFTMTAGRRIILTHGAAARNIFWAVGTSATLGTNCSFSGNMLVHQSISMGTGTAMSGRALTQIGAVTMQSNTVVTPAR
jgi:hypothetical protein